MPMYHQEFEPPDELRDSIKCFWYNRRDFGDTPSSFEIIPDGYAEIIFHFGRGSKTPCSVSSKGISQILPSPCVMGLLDQPVHITSTGTMEIMAVRCFPWTLFDLLGLPSGKDGAQIFEHPIAQLQEPLRAWVQASKIDEALTLVTRYFLDARAGVPADSLLSKAGSAMSKAKGTLPVRQVADAAHATVRTLERQFKRSSGYSVKDVSGLMRFEQVRNELWLHPQTTLADLALTLGYTDQSHLSREFKRYSGTTPAAFAKKAKSGQQILGGDFVAFVQA